MRMSIVGIALIIRLMISVTVVAQEPDGILFRESFDDDRLEARGWYDGTGVRIVGNGAVGTCIEYEWTKRGGGVSGSSTIRHLFEPTDRFYCRYYLRFSKGWGWSGRNYHPHLINFMTTENGPWHGPAGSHLTLYVEPVAGKLRLAAQDIQNKDAPHGLTQGPLRGGYNGKLYDSQDELFLDDAGEGVGSRFRPESAEKSKSGDRKRLPTPSEQWHCVEAYFQLNTLDLAKDSPNADGICRGWFGGKLVVEHKGVVFRSTDFPKMQFNQLLLAPFFGPGLVPHAQKLWVDELVVSTKPIGPLAEKK